MFYHGGLLSFSWTGRYGAVDESVNARRTGACDEFFYHIKDYGDARGGLDVANTSVLVEGKIYGRAFV